ncbi:hypothetical protein HLB44_16830 [Aquincola sp. S2]|uniref:Uncharacterized protein n=1 Tax=Pseudaquabacterium terrae TaxID=2732868 RepID=A0ABX2EJ39_9BURK|nr:hypothetical protein [Aquabacterium terrae]NRF68659.1 hypothetical protein [Aquabacterium terrae]
MDVVETNELAVFVEDTTAGRLAFLDIGEQHDVLVLGRGDLLRLQAQVSAALARVDR